MAHLYNDLRFEFFSDIPEMSAYKSWDILRDEKKGYEFAYIFHNFYL